ncbi:antibiotic biosynthesis monooxygenase family protein [Pseudoalteromonas luteoviolacea]|uniref:ABM domain-containing protein n=1 Tax=Pseudoalteromonas luteoviolacea NCIMB 1942 TaxID=1365253 RepID=A0A166Y944_9GAMM|nr:hypothetical protein [Pseudoalteromonas luteoviolacea]KZN41576.1 hypothetical protein N482_20070 [Pseudoalteromonas luteoviolacea NCIMB 1942]
MNYIIDIYTTDDKSKLCQYLSDNLTERVELAVEIYTKFKEVKDAFYDVLVVYKGLEIERDVEQISNNIDQSLYSAHERIACRIAIELGQLQDTLESGCWLINPFEITTQQIPDVIDMWDKAKDDLIHKPGFVHARLFQALTPHPKYNLINVAHWVSESTFTKAIEADSYSSHRQRSLQYKLHPALCKSR